MLNTLHTRTVRLVASLLIATSPKTGGGIHKNNFCRRQIGCRGQCQHEYSVHYSTSLSACFHRVLLLTTRFRTWFWEARVSTSANIVATTPNHGTRGFEHGTRGIADRIFETGIATVTAKLYSRGARTAFLPVAYVPEFDITSYQMACRHGFEERI